jgi:hypothetical protein
MVALVPPLSRGRTELRGRQILIRVDRANRRLRIRILFLLPSLVSIQLLVSFSSHICMISHQMFAQLDCLVENLGADWADCLHKVDLFDECLLLQLLQLTQFSINQSLPRKVTPHKFLHAISSHLRFEAHGKFVIDLG